MIQEGIADSNMVLVSAAAVIITETLNVESMKNYNYLMVVVTRSLRVGDNVVKKKPHHNLF